MVVVTLSFDKAQRLAKSCNIRRGDTPCLLRTFRKHLSKVVFGIHVTPILLLYGLKRFNYKLDKSFL